MAALTKDRITERKELGFKAYRMAASTKIYAGSLVALNTSGYAVPAADTAGFQVIGIADAQYDNSTGAAADLWCKVFAPCLAKLPTISITQAMLGRPMFVVDDQTVDDAQGTNKVLAGVLREYVSATLGWVEVGGLSIGQLAGNYLPAAGQATTVTASDTIVTGLALVVGVVVSLNDDPSDDPFLVTATIGDQAGTPAAGSFILKTWKNTGGTDPTPLAATTFSKKVNWWAFGI